MSSNKIEIYCDGSSEGNSTGKGGWAYVILVNGVEYARNSGGLKVATNNIAEISAAIEGMEFVLNDSINNLPNREIVLISDSQLVLKYATREWSCKSFHLVSLYCRLCKLFKSLGATTRWVKGHNKDTYNEICDALAKHAKEELMNGLQKE